MTEEIIVKVSVMAEYWADIDNLKKAKNTSDMTFSGRTSSYRDLCMCVMEQLLRITKLKIVEGSFHPSKHYFLPLHCLL